MTYLYVPHVIDAGTTRAALQSVYGQPCYRIAIDSGTNENGLGAHADDVIRLPHGTRFAAVMNRMQQDARERDASRFFFLHADAEVAPDGVAMMLAEADRLDAEGRRWGVIFSLYDAFCLFNRAACEAVGPWDESFAWYVSDADYYNRLRWAGFGWHELPSACKVHHGSRTLANLDDAARSLLTDDQQWAIRHYRHKWGCHWEEGDGRRWVVPYGPEGMADSGILTRPGSWDMRTWREVADGDEYGLRRFPLGPDSLVLDIGANVGAFTYLALSRGAGHVLACEPDPLNYPLLNHNARLAGPGRSLTLACACWRSDVTTPSLKYRRGVNTVCGSTLPHDDSGEIVPALGLDALVVLGMTWSGQDSVALLKLDCEGAEWPILAAANLEAIDRIVGEYHDCSPDVLPGGPTTGAQLLPWLRNQGFVAESDGREGRGLFTAWRPGRGP